MVAAKLLPGSWIRRIDWVLALAGVVLLLPRLWKFAQVSLTFIAWPWQFDFSEGVNLNAAYLMANGTNIYRHADPNYFVSAPYTPLFYMINVPVTWLFGPTFGPGRTISFLATLAIAVMLAYCVWKLTSFWGIGILAGALWLSASPVMVWSALYTQSTLAPAFELAGFAWILARPQGRASYVAILFFTLAFYTKQTAVDVPIAVAAWLLLRDVRHGLRFGFAFGAALTFPLVIGNILTRGGMWEHTVSNHVLPWKIDRWWKTVTKFLSEFWPIVLGATGGVALVVGKLFADHREQGNRIKNIRQALSTPLALACMYLIITVVTTMLRLGRDGANYNHVLDMLIPICLMVSVAISFLLRHLEKLHNSQELLDKQTKLVSAPRVAFAAIGVLFLAQLWLMSDPVVWYRGQWPSPENGTQMQLISNLVASTPGDIYSEDSYLVLSNGRQVQFDDAFMFEELATRGRWDDSVYNQKLKDRSFALILLEHGLGRFTDEGRRLFYENYHLLYEDVRDSYVPNQ